MADDPDLIDACLQPGCTVRTPYVIRSDGSRAYDLYCPNHADRPTAAVLAPNPPTAPLQVSTTLIVGNDRITVTAPEHLSGTFTVALRGGDNPAEIVNPPRDSGAPPGSRAWMADVMERVFEECRQLRGAGQKEYAQDEGNSFANFEDDAEACGISREMVLSIFANKHWRGIRAHIKGHRSQREDVRGRLNDMVVYLVLLRGMLDQNGADDAALTRCGTGVAA